MIRIRGGKPLAGTVQVASAKNAVLPVLAASLLAEGETVITSLPPLNDVFTIAQLLLRLGVDVQTEQPGTVRIRTPETVLREAPYELVRRMRASILVMGPLLARFGRAKVSLPGGCAIGNRPIDLHLKGFQTLGARIQIRHGFVEAVAERLRGARIYLDYPSHTATENILMAAVLAEGITYLENAAEEPEVVDLADFLNAMGARIEGAGTKIIRIQGVESLKGTCWTCIPDRIEAGTFMAAVGVTGGDIILQNVIPAHLQSVIAKFEEAGLEIRQGDRSVRVIGPPRPGAMDIKTLPYPGFPTDMQAPLMAMMATADGISVITESVFENRFLHVEELKRMGADIRIEGTSAIIRGVPRLTGTQVRATDLRAGAALVLAALGASGETEVAGTAHIDRGYVNLTGKLKGLGADLTRLEREPISIS